MQKKEKKLLIILDTNIIISHIWGSVNSSRILHEVLIKHSCISVFSKELMDELKQTLKKPKIANKIEIEDVEELLDGLKASSEFVDVFCKLDVCEDPFDNMLFECAQEANADYLISGDKKVLAVKKHKNTKVISPANFIEFVLNRES